MRADFDLEFLQYCDNEDLVSLCNILMFDNDGNLRLSSFFNPNPTAKGRTTSRSS